MMTYKRLVVAKHSECPLKELIAHVCYDERRKGRGCYIALDKLNKELAMLEFELESSCVTRYIQYVSIEGIYEYLLLYATSKIPALVDRDQQKHQSIGLLENTVMFCTVTYPFKLHRYHLSSTKGRVLADVKCAVIDKSLMVLQATSKHPRYTRTIYKALYRAFSLEPKEDLLFLDNKLRVREHNRETHDNWITCKLTISCGKIPIGEVMMGCNTESDDPRPAVLYWISRENSIDVSSAVRDWLIWRFAEESDFVHHKELTWRQLSGPVMHYADGSTYRGSAVYPHPPTLATYYEEDGPDFEDDTPEEEGPLGKLEDEMEEEARQAEEDFGQVEMPMPCKANPHTFNVGKSDYAQHNIQPWDIWIEYQLNPFDADIIKRVLRRKKGEARAMDYHKIIHICRERIRQLSYGKDPFDEKKMSDERHKEQVLVEGQEENT